MPCPSPVLPSSQYLFILEHIIQHNIEIQCSITRSSHKMQVLDNTPIPVPDPICDWPIHFYVNRVVGERIQCMATDCTFTCPSDDPMETLLQHYKDMCFSFEADALSRLENGLLEQMWKQEICLECQKRFPENNPRAAFGHFTEIHRVGPIFTTIPGFLAMVRMYGRLLPTDSADRRKYRRDTFVLSFEHAKLKLTEGPIRESPRECLSRFMAGNPDYVVPHDVLLRILTQDGGINYLPTHPDYFLYLNTDFAWIEAFIPWTSQARWDQIRHQLQYWYRWGFV